MDRRTGRVADAEGRLHRRPPALASALAAVVARRNQRVAHGVLIASACLLVALAFQHPWVHEDAFITLRTIDQFVHGNGLRWIEANDTPRPPQDPA